MRVVAKMSFNLKRVSFRFRCVSFTSRETVVEAFSLTSLIYSSKILSVSRVKLRYLALASVEPFNEGE